jgi:thiosulfate reductase cytochrome b subunit
MKNRLLLATDCKGSTAWHLAAGWAKLDALQKIFVLITENITPEEIKINFLLATDIKRNTVWYLAALRGKVDLLQKIWYLSKDHLTTEEIIYHFLLPQTVMELLPGTGQNVWAN